MKQTEFNKKSENLFYLLGLICGKGHIINESSIAINFNHGEHVEGIGYCPKCGWHATGFTDLLKCKNSSCKNSNKMGGR